MTTPLPEAQTAPSWVQRRALLPWRPPTGAGRLLGIDVARGIALLGMVVTHVFAATGDDGRITANHAVFAGRASALFAVLAGVSTALLTGRREPLRGSERARASGALAVRALLLALLGFVLVATGAPIAVILTYYGVLFLCGLPFLGLRPPALLALAAGSALLLPVLSFLLRDALDLGLSHQQPAFSRLDEPGRLLQELFLVGYYPVLPWLAYLLLGLAVGRLDLTAPLVAVRLLVGGACLAVGAHVLSAVLVTAGSDVLTGELQSDTGLGLRDTIDNGSFGVLESTGTWWLLVVDGPHTGTPLDIAATSGSALAVIGTCLLALQRGGVLLRALLLPLAAVGSMTLTLYSLHVWLVSEWDRQDPGAFYVQQLVVALVAALLWRTLVGRGPLEAVLAALTRLIRSSGQRRTVD